MLKDALLWQLKYAGKVGSEREQWHRDNAQENAETGSNLPTGHIEDKPWLGLDPDLERLLDNFNILSQTRQPAFGSPGTLRLSDIFALFDVEIWAEAGWTKLEYAQLVLWLDSLLHEHHAKRKPTDK